MADFATTGDIDEEYDESLLDSDEEADRNRKLQGQGKIVINNEEGLLRKLGELQKDFDQGILERLDPSIKKKKVSWLERLDITSDQKIEIVSSEVNDDIQREVRFYNIALQNVKNGLTKLKGMNQKLMRPNDYLVEMFKSDDVMQRVKSNLVKQQIKIQNFEEKKLRRDNKKFQKKFQQVKAQDKIKEKKRNLAAIDKWKQEIKNKGEGAADLSAFLKNDPGKGGKRGGNKKNLSDMKNFNKPAGRGGQGRGGKGGKGGAPKGGKKKIAKRPGKTQRTNNRNKKGSRR